MSAESPATLPAKVTAVLNAFIDSAKSAFGSDLLSVVLYGSGAEGKLRPTSDVNLILLLAAFDREKADRLREPLRLAQAAINVRVMFLLRHEVQPASEAFAVKFADILRRHQVLYGEDPFATVSVSRQDAIQRLKQSLLNLALRLREAYISRGLREEQLAAMIADAAGPLRSCAATLLELEGKPAPSAKEALEQLSAFLPGDVQAVRIIPEARKRHILPPGTAAPALFHLLELAHAMWARATELK